MSEKTLRNLDIYNPNFDYSIVERIEAMTPEEIERMPLQLKFKVFKGGKASVDKMNFNEKLFLLSVCFNETIIISTLAKNGGVTINTFQQAIDAQDGSLNNAELLNNMQIPTLFVQSDKELMRAWQYMNHVQCSEIYNLIRSANPKENSKREIKYREYQKNLAGVFRTICNYESSKKDVIIQFGLSVPKIYALLYFYDGEKLGTDFYNKAFRHAYTSNKSDLATGLVELYRDGYLMRRGTRKNLKYSITSSGIDLVTRFMNKLIYNY